MYVFFYFFINNTYLAGSEFRFTIPVISDQSGPKLNCHFLDIIVNPTQPFGGKNFVLGKKCKESLTLRARNVTDTSYPKCQYTMVHYMYYAYCRKKLLTTA